MVELGWLDLRSPRCTTRLDEFSAQCVGDQVSRQRPMVQGVVSVASDSNRNDLRDGSKRYLTTDSEALLSLRYLHFLHAFRTILGVVSHQIVWALREWIGRLQPCLQWHQPWRQASGL